MHAMDEEALGRLLTWIDARMARDGTPGLSLAVVDRTGVIHASGHGLADIAAGIPVTPAHLFETGSIGKSFTAVALLQLADEGRIDLQAPVTDYLPWFSVRSDHEPIRLHHLLSHTAGITAGLDFAPAGPIQVWALRDAVAATPPGSSYHYSNVGYKVLGEVLRAVTGEGYGPTIQHRILDPLGLVDSVPTIGAEVYPRLAVGYAPLADDRPWWPGEPLIPATWLETDTADGCLAMTASDLATYLRMLLGRGELDGARVLSEQAFDLLTQRAIATDDPPEDVWYGYGNYTVLNDGSTQIGHDGGMVGYSAAMFGDLETGVGVVALVNGPGAEFLIAATTLEFVNAERAGTPFDFPPIADPASVDDAEAYAGDYLASEGEDGPAAFRVTADGPGLTLVAEGVDGRIRSYWSGEFLADLPSFARFPLRFSGDEEEGRSATYGDRQYRLAGEPTPAPVEFPAEWAAYPGHYHSFSPWNPSLQVRLRRGRLWLLFASEPDGFETEQPLVPLADGDFRAGDDPRIPERIRFDAIIDGHAHRAHLSGCDFYRVETS